MAVNEDIFVGSGANLAFVPELILSGYIDEGASTAATGEVGILASFSTNLELVPNLYKGCTVELFDVSQTPTISTMHTITSNTTTAFIISPITSFTIASDDTDYFHIHPYGAPCPAKKTGSNSLRLNADNWMGIVETATFPNTEIEMKQMNLALGGTRNFTYQYKGMETSSGGSINLIANHGAWLYYALGKCTGVKLTTTTGTGVDPTDAFNAHLAGSVYFDTGDTATTDWEGVSFETTHISQGPIFYRADASSVTLLPPIVIGIDTDDETGGALNFNLLTSPTYVSGAIDEAITYQFDEANGADLPSFSLEHSIAKTTNTTATQGTTTETETLVRIARGNRVNTLTMTANENEEVKMTMDLNTRTVDYINDLTTTQVYTPRNAVTTDSSLFNYSVYCNGYR